MHYRFERKAREAAALRNVGLEKLKDLRVLYLQGVAARLFRVQTAAKNRDAQILEGHKVFDVLEPCTPSKYRVMPRMRLRGIALNCKRVVSWVELASPIQRKASSLDEIRRDSPSPTNRVHDLFRPRIALTFQTTISDICSAWSA